MGVAGEASKKVSSSADDRAGDVALLPSTAISGGATGCTI